MDTSYGLKKDLHPDAVTRYLLEHPGFLENHVLQHVSKDTLCTWAGRKPNAPHGNGPHVPLGNGPHVQHGNGPGVNGQDHVTEQGDVPEQETHSTEHVNSQHSKNGSGEGTHENRRCAQYKIGINGDKSRLLREVTRNVHLHETESNVINDLASCVAAAIDAEGYHLHVVDQDNQKVQHNCHSTNSNALSLESFSRPVGPGSTLAAFTAHTKESIRLPTNAPSSDYPEAGPGDSDQTGPVLAQPVIQSNGQALAVIEFFREKGSAAFTDDDEEIYRKMENQRKLNEYLLKVTEAIFQDMVSMDLVIMKIMNFAKKLVNADRTALFMVDQRKKELYARVFDMGRPEESSNPKAQQEIRFPMNKGVAGHVASTGQVLNIQDAYRDDRFNRDVDVKTGYTTKTILCMPIRIRGDIIGVVQMLNKEGGVFNHDDEEAFQTFSTYCGLALFHAKLYDKIKKSEQKYKVALEVLSYHSKAPEEEITHYLQQNIPNTIENLTDYSYSPWSVPNEDKPMYVIFMFKDLFNTQGFDMSSLFRFTLTVRKNYRNVPYHNWAHAFSVAHAMYTIIKTTENHFTPLEWLSLYVACICHDVDHRGYDNSYMARQSSPLASIYSTSTMEHHHFNHTITILQQEGHNIFKHLSADEYKQVLADIKHCILATDLALFFGNRARLKQLQDQKEFSWTSKDHRRLLGSITMTACDLVASAKPWDVQLQTVKVIFEEFYVQGDEEKLRGETPNPMMDRDQQHNLPKLEVGFLLGICLPCYELLADILPETTPMVDGAKKNHSRWQHLDEENKKNSADNRNRIEQ